MSSSSSLTTPHHDNKNAVVFYSFDSSLHLFEDPQRVNRLHACQDLTELCKLIIENHNQIKGRDEELLPTDNSNDLPGLTSAVEALGGPGIVLDFTNPNGLFRRLVLAASELNLHFPFGTIPTLSRQNRNSSIHFNTRQVVCILANAFLGNLSRIPLIEPKTRPTHTVPHYGSLSWHLVFNSSSTVATERAKGLLLYFQHALLNDSSTSSIDQFRTITFRRVALSNTFNLSNAILQAQHLAPVTFVHGGVELALADAVVDFANESLHIGAVWPCATQEEILFSIYSECFPGLLFCETMNTTEAIRIDGVRAYCKTNGFQHTFRVTGPSYDSRPKTVLAMDASMADSDKWISDQSSGPYRDRDLLKAIAGFSTMAGKSVATGNWGCGAFGGDVYCKFLIQLMAATICNVSLVYCLVDQGSDEVRSSLSSIYDGLWKNQCTVSDIYRAMSDYQGPESPTDIKQYFLTTFS